MSQLPALAQWAGLALIIIGGWIVGPGFGLVATGAAILIIGVANETPE